MSTGSRYFILIPLFCAILILVGFMAYNFGYYQGSSHAFNLGYKTGYDQGYFDGNLTGYRSGYKIGYGQGYFDGDSAGYSRGYETGRYSGYESGYVDGNKSGYEMGYDDGYRRGVIDGAGRGFNIRDPTYREMLEFIARDKTDKNPYVEDEYVCWNFAADVKMNAFREGYKCGLVIIELEYGAHAIVCFNTTDRGLIFIEPQTDEIVQISIGKYYGTQSLLVRGGYIKRYAIIW